jgi:TolA-binding protein
MFTVSAYKKQTHKVEQLNSTITTIEQQKQSTETELQKTKETDSQNQQRIKELEEKIKQLEADLQAREARKQLVANDPCRLVYDYTEWDARVMYAICKAESGGNPSIIGDTNITYYQDGELYGMSCGMLQVRVLPGRNITCEEMHNPEKNVAKAFEIWKSQSYKAWSMYTNGRYLDYI